jgi:hypothetical protein
MKQFVTILHEQPSGMAEVSPAQIQELIEKYMEWTRGLREQNRIRVETNLNNRTGKTIRGFGSESHVTDGPYSETKEVIGGLHIIEAESWDDALEWARRCPALEMGATLELREVEDWNGYEEHVK